MESRPRATDAGKLNLLLALIALAALTLPLLIARTAPAPVRARTVAMRPHVVVPPTVLPPVEPVEFEKIAPEDARAFNASVPLVEDAVDPARPYRMQAAPDDLARATDCLAAAVLYEAGDDAVGEQAVAQVVLNRLRHPAFPKTVCGVVFQGSERATGCQFTFTCDGALHRVPGEAAWRRAREVARAALAGFVDRSVGLATHYHTDYVVPYWQSSLDKIAQVHTHLFFRWTGWWGTPAAFRRVPVTVEPPVPQLAFLSPAHASGELVTEIGAVVPTNPFFGRAALPLPGDPDVFITALNPGQVESFAAMAQAACGERERCKFMGWTDTDQMPFTAAMSPQQMAAMSFSYLRDRSASLERTLWNCGEFKRPPLQCMKRSTLRIPAPPLLEADRNAVRLPDAPVLTGVRRKSDPPPPAAAAGDGPAPNL